MKKKTFAIVAFSMMVLSSHAQLRVNQSGKVLIGDSLTTLSSGLTVNKYGVGQNAAINMSQLKSQLSLYAFTTGTCNENTAIKGEATNTPPPLNLFATVNCGVHGLAGNNRLNIGVMGGLTSSSTNGAGIYGTQNSTAATLCNGNYAGFFEGDVRVTKALAATVTNPHDCTSISDVTALGSVLDDIDQINVYRYDQTGLILRDGGDAPDAFDPSIRPFGEEQHHTLLNIPNVKNVFPYLVETNGQGNDYVKYTEIIPVLVKAIQELKAQVDALSGRSGNGDQLMAPMHTATSDVNSLAGQTAKLHQNNPNPFTERTEIRFSVPEDARSAYLYIFDMSGKMLRQIPVDASMQSVAINGYELPAGIYIYSLTVNGREIDTKRMILSK